MAVTIASVTTSERLDWGMHLWPARGTTILDTKVNPFPIAGGVASIYRQKCRDTVSGIWTDWTTPFIDLYGSNYPGAGFDAGTFRVVAIFYDRYEP